MSSMMKSFLILLITHASTMYIDVADSSEQFIPLDRILFSLQCEDTGGNEESNTPSKLNNHGHDILTDVRDQSPSYVSQFEKVDISERKNEFYISDDNYRYNSHHRHSQKSSYPIYPRDIPDDAVSINDQHDAFKFTSITLTDDDSCGAPYYPANQFNCAGTEKHLNDFKVESQFSDITVDYYSV